jgi:hypothetical protein
MAVNLLVYQKYKDDSMWAARVESEPMNDVKFLLPPECFFKSELADDWTKCITDYPADIRLPSVGRIVVCMQFESGVDAGLGFNKVAPVAYKTIKYGKKFVCKNPDPAAELTRKDFDHDTWENYLNMDKELIWKIGDTTNNFVVEIVAGKSAPIECQKNYESCDLYVYRPTKIIFHFNNKVADLIKKMYAEGKGFIRAPTFDAPTDTTTPGAGLIE